MKLFRSGATACACLLLFTACQQNDQSDEETSEDVSEELTEEEETPAVPVEVAVPIRGDIFATYSGTAPIEAFAEADVIAKVEGEIRTLLVEEGDVVERTQVLAALDGDRLTLELNESEARLQKLRSDYARNRELQDKDLISEGDFEKIRYDLEALEASYNLAKLELDYTQIRAAIPGVISERYVKLGNTVKVGDPLFRVTSLDPLVAYVHVPEREFRRIAAGQPVQIEIDAMPDEPVAATVTRVSPIVDPTTGTFKITVEIRGNAGNIKPGMFGRINIIYDVHENVLQIPRTAITDRAGAMSIFVVKDGVGIKRSIETGFSNDGMVEVINGLSDGEQVITVGHVGLKNESNVVVINADDTSASSGDSE